jgi:hypothetical protein
VANCLVSFGGFDGDFFNDINLLELTQIDNLVREDSLQD